MIKQTLLIISLLSTVSSFAQTGDTVSVQQNVLEREQLRLHFIEPAFHNPALHYYQYNSSLSTLAIKGDVDDLYDYSVAQKGDSWKGFNIGAQSYMRLSDNSSVWGKAYYENGKKENVLWNESSDFDIVYPYVAADTIGGDMKSSTYYFNGGYAQRHKNWTFGGEFSYRALMEFRDKDPRPKNTIADLRGKIGASYNLFNKYAVAVAAEAQKYKQNGDIQYYNELGVSKTFHLQGLGVSFVRFDGTNNSVNYQGNQWGVMANLLPTSEKGGFFANASYHKDFKEKILPIINDITLNELKESRWSAELGWHSATYKKNQFGVKGYVSGMERNGSEYFYGDPSGNIYPVIAIKENFKRKLTSYRAAAFYQRNHTNNWMFGANLLMGYHTHKESHKASQNRLECNALTTNFDVTSVWKWKKQMVKLTVGGEYLTKQDAILDLKRVTTPYARQILIRNFYLYSADIIGYHASARWSSVVWKNKLIYLEANWAQRRYIDIDKGYKVNIMLGMSF